MTSSPLIKLSILIPMYNSERFIVRCLDSILCQKIEKEEYEIIVFDDGSTDSSRKLVEDYSKVYKNIRVYSEQNKGAYIVRNKMLNIARGKYIYFMDSDDFLINQRLGYLLDIAISRHLDLIGFAIEFEHDEIVNYNNLESTNSDMISLDIPEIQKGLDFIAENKGMRHEIWWYIIRKDFLKINDIIFHEAPYSSDVMFTVETFVKAKRCMYFPVTLYKYVLTSGSCTRNKTREHRLKLIETRIDMIIHLSKFIDSLDNTTIHERLVKGNLNFRKYRYVYITLFNVLAARIKIETFERYMLILTEHKAYPIKNIKEVGYNIPKYKIISSIFNSRRLLKIALLLLNLKKF